MKQKEHRPLLVRLSETPVGGGGKEHHQEHRADVSIRTRGIEPHLSLAFAPRTPAPYDGD